MPISVTPRSKVSVGLANPKSAILVIPSDVRSKLAGLMFAMHEPDCVGCRQSSARIRDHPDRFCPREAVLSPDEILPAAAIDEFHGQIVGTLDLVDLVNGDHIGDGSIAQRTWLRARNDAEQLDCSRASSEAEV